MLFVDQLAVRRFVALGLSGAGALLLAGCGQSSDDAGQGGVLRDGQTPVFVQNAGKRYLQDLTAYQPSANQTWGSSAIGDEGGAPVGVASPEAAQAVAARVTELTDLIFDEELRRALRLFNPEHVQPLLDDNEPALENIFNTLSQIRFLTRELEVKLSDQAAARKLVRLLMFGTADKPKHEVFSGGTGAVTPNVARVMFGPVKTGPTLGIASTENDWLFQLESPLEAGDMAALMSYHDEYGTKLAALIDFVSQVDTLSLPEAQKLIEELLSGAAPSIPPKEPEASPGNANDQAAPDDNNSQPEEQPEQPTEEPPGGTP
jgi:hypothetical protein